MDGNKPIGVLMSITDSRITLEQRVERIEKQLNKRHWLDEDSGYVLDPNAPLPWPMKIIGGFIGICSVGFIGLLIYAKVMG